MNSTAAALILASLLLGPIVLAPIERSLEAWFFVLGIIAAMVAGVWSADLVRRALGAPILVTISVVISGVIFGHFRPRLDAAFMRLRRRVSRPILTATTLFLIALLSSAITAIVAALVLLEAVALEPLADKWLLRLGRSTLFWANTASAALDNATLVALEAHGLGVAGLPWAMASFLISGGMLIPGNIPNIVCAGKLDIRSLEWARVAIPLGVVMLGIAFAVLRLS